MMNVLVTSASRKVGLIRAFQEALAREGGGKVLAADSSPLAAALYAADDHVLLPPSAEPGFADALLRLCERERISLLVPTRDEELPLMAEQKGRFEAAGTVVMVPGAETVWTCQDKARFLDVCEARGFAVPRRLDPRAAGGLPFPLFVKPRFGKSGRGAERVGSREELGAALRRLPEPIVQEHVAAPEYTIDLFADLAGRVLSAVPRERVLVMGGESFVSRTAKIPALVETSVRLAEALGLTGHNTIQCFLDKGVVKLIEVNPRFGGAAHLSFAAGAPSPRFLVRLLLGRPVERAIDDFTDGLVMLRYTEDLFIPASDLTRRSFP